MARSYVPTEQLRSAYLNRRARERQEVLDDIAQKVKDGSLVIRQMTAEEKEFWGPPKNLKRPKGQNRSLAVPFEHDAEWLQLEDAA